MNWNSLVKKQLRTALEIRLSSVNIDKKVWNAINPKIVTTQCILHINAFAMESDSSITTAKASAKTQHTDPIDTQWPCSSAFCTSFLISCDNCSIVGIQTTGYYLTVVLWSPDCCHLVLDNYLCTNKQDSDGLSESTQLLPESAITGLA